MHTRLIALFFIFSMLIANIAAAQAPVEAEAVTTRNIVHRLSVTGTVTSPRTSVLSTAVAGLVSELFVDEGHRVGAGDVLLSLDPELAQLALERAAAEVRQSEAALADIRRRLDEAERVGPERGIPRTQIESLRSEVAIDKAALVAARAAASEQAAVVERHRLKAPFAGVISQRFAELGEWVNPGDGLLELVDTDNLRFDFRVSQNYFSELTNDTPVRITLDALPGESVSGRVEAIVPVKNAGARTFLLRVVADGDVPASPLAITPGMSASAALSLATGRTGIVVSRDAILRFPDGRVTVWLVNTRNGVTIVRERIVRTGLEFDGFVEVTQGLEDGDLVVTRGNESLQEDQAVAILGGGP